MLDVMNHEADAEVRLGTEISVTGKWVPRRSGTLVRKSPDTVDFLKEWEGIHMDARAAEGILETELSHAVGENAVLVHHVFRDAEAMVDYFGGTARAHEKALLSVAKPELHLIRGVDVPAAVTRALTDKGVPVATAKLSHGFVRDHAQADPATAVHATAKWACKPGSTPEMFEDLKHWWRMANDHARTHEPGLRRFEVYEVEGEHALVTHDTFESTDALKFHLTKGAAAKFKAEIDKVAAPENYYFRGPVQWMIRTYSRFMHLPATYALTGQSFVRPGGSLSSGTL